MKNLDEYIVEMEKEMGGNKWWVEDNVKNRAGAPKNAEHGQPLVLTDQDYSLRPYAVLDYILTPVTPVIYLRCVSYNEDCVIFLSIKTDSTPYSRLIWRKTRPTISLNDASDNIYKGNRRSSKPKHASYYYLHAYSAGARSMWCCR
jgi:hypothetical protein